VDVPASTIPRRPKRLLALLALCLSVSLGGIPSARAADVCATADYGPVKIAKYKVLAAGAIHPRDVSKTRSRPGASRPDSAFALENVQK
jgi:hypothetical protein